MAPNASWDDISSTTIELMRDEIADNITDNNALLAWLKQGGNVDPAPGGRTLVEQLEYAESTNAQWMSDYEEINTAAQQLFSAAEFQWKQATCFIGISGTEMIQNSGESAMINLLNSRIENGKRSLVNLIGTGIYSDGTAAGGKQIGGLQYLISATPTASSVIGGINQSTYSFWQNQLFDCTATGACSAANIRRYLQTLRIQCTRNSDSPDVCVLDQNYFIFLQEALAPLQVLQDSKLAKMGFEAIKLPGMEVLCDGGQGGNCPASTGYMINSKYLKFRPHPEYNVTLLPGQRLSTNQWALGKILGFAGNLTVSNRKLQGTIHE